MLPELHDLLQLELLVPDSLPFEILAAGVRQPELLVVVLVGLLVAEVRQLELPGVDLLPPVIDLTGLASSEDFLHNL